ncbi:hypothetical protein [Microlunatus sp. GCM10028923]|uniref:hypothetical protein n=1 Tax=Microlunatus sp. GCM10028923 TaxID=3273400 RepID=UPI00360EF5B6
MITPTEPPRDRLPRDRDLPDLQDRLDLIVREARRPAARPTRHVLPIVAAIAVIIALVTAAALILPGRPDVIASPPEPSVSPPAGTATTYRIGDRVKLRYVAVTLREARQNKDGLSVAVQTCLLAPPPTDNPDEEAWYSWEAVTDRGTYVIEPFQTFDKRGHSSIPVFPGRTEAEVGECVEGWLPFAGLGSKDGRVVLTYRDNFDESARWSIR